MKMGNEILVNKIEFETNENKSRIEFAMKPTPVFFAVAVVAVVISYSSNAKYKYSATK